MTAALWRRPGAAWCAVAALLALGSAVVQGQPATRLDWQPGLVTTEPWRVFSAAFVHYSKLHLAGNAAGLALVAALGAAARAPWWLAPAWLAAWPLTQLGLLVRPDLLHYGGLSGVVHAGVAIVGVHLAAVGRRVLGGAILGVLLAKVVSETPWGPVLRHPPGWDIAIAPLAHAGGALAGAGCAVVAETAARWRQRRRARTAS